MEMHSVGSAVMQAEIERLKKQHVKTKPVEGYTDPIREFSRVSRFEGMARGWMTYPLDEKKRLIKESFTYMPQTADEKDQAFSDRMLERWRTLCVILQEESRLRYDASTKAWVQGSPEIATACLKLLYPTHDWKK